MTPLRKKMTHDLRLRNLSNGTSQIYIGCIARFARHYGVSPEKLGTKEVREYLLMLQESGLTSATQAVYHAALTFLYVQTLGRPEVMALVPRPRVRTSEPSTPLTLVEMRILMDVLAENPFNYTFFATMLATGIRISECCSLSVHDIDRRAGLVHIRRGKGGKPRTVMLSNRLLRLLERYWQVEAVQGEWLFPAQRMLTSRVREPRWTSHHVSTSTMGKRLRVAVARAGLKRRVTSHDFRRTFATWLLENEANLRLVQVLLGHASLVTTARYTQIHPNVIANTKTPYDLL